MTERERLIEILNEWGNKENDGVRAESIADYLLENGMIVPPCKVGTHLYFLSGDLEECEIIESSSWLYIVDSLGRIIIEETLYELNYEDDYDYVFGVTVFSTYKEAEKALEEMKK